MSRLASFCNSSVPAIAQFKSNHNSKWNISKVYMRCCSFALSIILIGLSASHGASVITLYDLAVPAWYLCLPLVLYSIHLDSTELMCAFVRGRNPGIAPSWYAALELALLIANITVLGFISTCLEYCDSSDYCDPTSHDIAVLVFTLLFSVTRLGLFIMACVDIHRRKAAAEITRLMQNGCKLDTTCNFGCSYHHARHGIPVPPQELPTGPRSPQELDNEYAIEPELEGSYKHPAQPSPIVRDLEGAPICSERLPQQQLGQTLQQDSTTVNEMPGNDNRHLNQLG